MGIGRSGRGVLCRNAVLGETRVLLVDGGGCPVVRLFGEPSWLESGGFFVNADLCSVLFFAPEFRIAFAWPGSLAVAALWRAKRPRRLIVPDEGLTFARHPYR